MAVYKIFFFLKQWLYIYDSGSSIATNESQNFNIMLKMELKFVAELLQKGSEFGVRVLPCLFISCLITNFCL